MGRPKVLRPCPHCGEGVGSREFDYHRARCPKRPVPERNPTHKICRGPCGEDKAIGEFPKHPSGTIDGRLNKCRDCCLASNKRYREERIEQERARTRAWHANNPEKSRNQAARFRINNPGYMKQRYWKNPELARAAAKTARQKDLEAFRAKQRAAYRANLEANREKSRLWGRAHSQQNAVNARKWREENREHHRRLRRNRQLKLRGNGGSHTLDEWHILVEACGCRCLCCGLAVADSAKLEPDHIVSVAKGGTDFIWNIQPLCRRCNIRKQAQIIDYRPRAIRQLYAEPLT